MTDHSDDCAALIVFDGVGDEAVVVDRPCSCGLDVMTEELRLLRDVSTSAQRVSMSAVGGPESGAPPGEQLVTSESVDGLRRALAALARRRTHA